MSPVWIAFACGALIGGGLTFATTVIIYVRAVRRGIFVHGGSVRRIKDPWRKGPQS